MDVPTPIDVRGLTKEYALPGGRRFTALSGLDFTVEKGEVFGFLGLNGAGKTTTIKMLTTVMGPTSGEAFVCGKSVTEEPMEVRRVIGYMPENPGFYPSMSGLAILEYFGRFYVDRETARERGELLIGKVGLKAFGHRPVSTYSLGMRKRLALASALVNDPEVLILDEPTGGLDPKGVSQFKMMIGGLAEAGITVLFSSHALADVEEVCHRVLIIHKGKLVTIRNVNELRESFLSRTKETVVARLETPPEAGVTERVRELSGVEEVKVEGSVITVVAAAGSRVAPEVNFILASGGVRVLELKTETPPLEKLFLEAVEGSA